ncbi:hypothetical protein [Burkholderia phage FLC9]|nr:hypothetical protein [Burkholderia phage FLC9]
MYLLRFKRPDRAARYYSMQPDQINMRLVTEPDLAVKFVTMEAAKEKVEVLQAMTFPKNTDHWEHRHLFLMKLYAASWEDQLEGMLINMDDIVKAQIVEMSPIKVVETIRMRCPVWETHYA